MKALFRTISHIIFRTRSFNNKCVKKFAKDIENKKILELGSGKPVNGKHAYSAINFFDASNEFTQSDINPGFGHEVINVETMQIKNQYDIILCMNVLEHVFDFNKAIKNIHSALKPGGKLILFVPVFYPLHDEPNDFWRFTEHALKKILKDFNIKELKHSGVRQYPFAYFVEAQK
tara:strand:- start:361 stop:885 length:525 start_codon:yes stop_codon:yes gene_type:complete